jgi:cytochrome c oxidase assembly protein subunit 11
VQKNDKTVVILLTVGFFAMLALAFASVPLYRVFCQKTGFGGTPKVSRDGSTQVINREITVRFVANTHRDLPWEFSPLQHTIRLKIGENGLAYYKAKNRSNKPIVGMATYNISPDVAGQYFNKVFCFCFEQQKLDPGETMEMPVQFFIDPAFVNDPLLKSVNEITLSYSFFVFKKQ